MDFLGFIGGLSFFLFGMNVMESGLRSLSGDKIKDIILKISGNSFKGIFLGALVTAVVQSSSAVTVSLIGLCEAEFISFYQSVPIIMGANIGTSATAWIVALTGTKSDIFLIKIFSTSTLSPIIGLLGVALIFSKKNNRFQNIGFIMMGFSLLISGIGIMSSAMESIADIQFFKNSFFNNPLSGLALGAVITAVIQSSSAGIGILQSLAFSGAVNCYTAVPIILGQNIGTCVTTLIACVSGSKESKKISAFHIIFNIFGSALWLTGFLIINNFINLNFSISAVEIAVVHTLFNLSTTFIMLPALKAKKGLFPIS